MGAFAEFESNQRGELISSVMKYLKKEQKVYCGPTPLGFHKKNGFLIVDKQEMEIVKTIFDWKRTMPHTTIAKLCNDSGFQTKKGKKFYHTTIDKIVNNNIYEQHLRNL